jgi:soluble lytic murein transglycosylase-like protein
MLPTLWRIAPFFVALSVLLKPSVAFAADDPVGSASGEPASLGSAAADSMHAIAQPADPRAYLYARAPDLGPRLDCIIDRESGWDPMARNPRSRASGLAQFLPSTWATTPQGQQGLSPFEPLANIDAAIWLARTRGWTQWQVFTMGRCR